MISPIPRVLVDIRETEIIRGYHAIAVTQLAVLSEPRTKWFCLTSGSQDEELAFQSLCFDTGLPMNLVTRLPMLRRFDLYTLIADRLPDDAVSLAAMRKSRATLAGLTFARAGGEVTKLVLADGNDTMGMAQQMLALLPSADRDRQGSGR